VEILYIPIDPELVFGYFFPVFIQLFIIPEIMKLKSLFFASVVAAAAIKKQALSDAEIVETLLKSPWLRPAPSKFSV
jgi:hypothetical protein